MSGTVIPGFTPPDGFHVEPLPGYPGCYAIQHPAVGWVSVNLKLRIYSFGYGVPRMHNRGSTKSFVGKGWVNCLCQAAVDELLGALAIRGLPNG